MTHTLHAETPMEYFKDVVEGVIARQRWRSSDDASYYLVQLLGDFVRCEKRYRDADVPPDITLAELMCGALATKGGLRFTRFKLVGDLALFASGFFFDSIARYRVEPDYYRRMGGYGYQRAARLDPRSSASVFHELSSKFGRFVDVLNEVSEECSLAADSGVLRLYERWLATGSERSADKLRRQGILLDRSSSQVH